MIERICRTMKASCFFTCRMYTVQVSAPYRRVESKTARYILPFTRMDTCWLFQSLWRNRPKHALALAILLCISSSMHLLLDVGEFQNRVQLVSIKHDIVLSGSCKVGVVQHLGLLDVNLQSNFFDASEKASTIFCISSTECATSALSFSHQYPSSLEEHGGQ